MAEGFGEVWGFITRMANRSYYLMQEPRSTAYRTLIDYALPFCTSLLLAVHDTVTDASVGEVLSVLQPFLLSSSRGSSYPGTILLYGAEAKLYRFAFNESSAHTLKEYAEGLYDWRQPGRPEDLCLFRSDGSVWLGSIAHERFAWVEMSHVEKERMVRHMPDLGPLSDEPPVSDNEAGN